MAKNLKMVTKPNAETRKALKQMNEALTNVYKEILDRTATLDRSNIIGRVEIGKIVDDVLADQDKYDENPVEKLAAALSFAPAELYRFRSVYSRFGLGAELTALLDRRMSNNHVLTFSHLACLASVETTKTREAFVERTFKDSLTVRDLQAAVQAKLGKRGNNKNGRPSVAPKSPSAALSTLSKATAQYVRIHDSLSSAVFDRVNSGDVDADTVMLERVDEALDGVDKVASCVADDKRKLTAIRAKLASMVAAGSRESSKKKLNKAAKVAKLAVKAEKAGKKKKKKVKPLKLKIKRPA